MTFLPIVEREIRIAARNPRTYLFRLSAATAALGLTGVFATYWFASSSGGHGLFTTLSIVGLVFCLFDGLRTSADCISVEKREGTLGLLFLTDLSGFDVVFGKLASTALRSFYGLLATFPILGLSLLMGGVTGSEFWRMVAALVTILLLSQSVAICVSSVVWRERAAHSWASTILMTIVILPLVPHWIALVGRSPDWWLTDVFSPYTLYQSVFAAGTGGARYAKSLLANLMVAGLFLVMAGILVRRHWQQKAVVAVGRRVARWRKIDEPRRRLLLDLNPMTWLALRFQQPRLEWAPVFLFGTISLASLGLGLAEFLTFSLGTGWLINFMMKMRLAGEGARIGSDLRQDSQLELIVTTPLGPNRMVEGLGAGLRAMIFPGAAALLALEFATLVIGLILTEHTSAGVGMSGVYVMALLYVPLTLLDFYAFAHTGLWLGFSSGKASAGINRTQLRLLVLPFLATIIFSIGMASTVGYLVGYLFSLGFLLQSQSRMKSEFAAIATGQQGVLQTPAPSFIFPAPPESPPVYRI